MCVCLSVGGGAGSREGIVYLYNLSNSPVLISEGPPSIYLDYPCPSAASFLPPLLLLGCVCVRAVLLVPPHVAPPGVVCALPCCSPQGILYGMDIILQGREVCSSPLARSFHSTAPDCSPCPVPGCAGEEDPPQHHSGTTSADPPNSLSSPPHVEPETEARVLGERGPS